MSRWVQLGPLNTVGRRLFFARATARGEIYRRARVRMYVCMYVLRSLFQLCEATHILLRWCVIDANRPVTVATTTIVATLNEPSGDENRRYRHRPRATHATAAACINTQDVP